VAHGPYTTPRLIRWPIITGLVLFVGYIVLIIGLGASSSNNHNNSASTKLGLITWYRAGVGDCFDQDSQVTLTKVDVVRCSRPHDGQVFANYHLGDGTFPGRARVKARAAEGCNNRVATSGVDVNADNGHLQVLFIYPDNVFSWIQDGERVLCLVEDQSGNKLVGSAVS
jgi:hypothetical protein